MNEVIPMIGERQPLNSAYRYGDGADTDDYLTKLTGSEVRQGPRKYEPSEVSAATSPKWNPTSAHFCARISTALVSVLFFFGGVGLIIMFSSKEKYLLHLWPIMFVIGIAVACLFILAGVVGLGGGCSGKDVVRRAALFIFSVGTIGIIVGFAFLFELKGGSEDDALLRNWKETIEQDPSRVCQIQSDLDCSGWNSACGNFWTHAPTNSTPAPYNTTAPSSPTYCAMCNNNWLSNKTCYDAFKDKVTHDFPYFGAVLGAAVVANAVLAFLVYSARGEEPSPHMTRV